MPFEVVFQKRINNANVYRDADVEQRKQYLLLTCLGTLFVMALLLYGWQQYRWIQLGYEIESAQKKKDDLIEHQRQLVLSRNTEARDTRIDLIARTDLGMVVAAPGQILTFKPEEAAPAPLSAAKR